MSIRKLFTSRIVTISAITFTAAAGALGATVALASSPVATTADTAPVYTAHLTGLADTAYGGTQPYNADGGEVWATDQGTVTFRVQSEQDNSGVYSYQGTWHITGTFLSLPGASDPNEPYDPYSSPLGGSLSGTLDVTFNADKPIQDGGTVDAASIPGAETTNQTNGDAYPSGLAWLTNSQMLSIFFPAGTEISSENTTGYTFTYTDAYGDNLVENTFTVAGQGGNLPGLGKITPANQDVIISAARKGSREYLRACVTSASRTSLTKAAEGGRVVFFRDGRGTRSVTLTTGSNGCTPTRELSKSLSAAWEWRAVAEATGARDQALSGFAGR